jgi:hypothetical protein
LDSLSVVSGLVVQQQKEWGEILSGFEFKNHYLISDESGQQLYEAREEDGSTLLRWFLKAMRPFSMKIWTNENQLALQITRPFRFYFHRAEIQNGQGQTLGTIERRFSVLRRVYSVMDSSGEEIYQLFGPLLHPWTFFIRKEGMDYGKITKEWSGLLQEGISDADNFGVLFPAEWDTKLKAVFLGAVFLIDFVHFENKGRH